MTNSQLREAVVASVGTGERLVLAVSGGRDSMVMFDAFLRWRASAIAAVATFDHGTGDAARSAADLVERSGNAAGIRVVRGCAEHAAKTEAGWRAARWKFLRSVSEQTAARVATAHTRDDQIETVFIRALRDAGPRGLAALYARSTVVRPLLDVSRDDVAAYAAVNDVEFIDDPSNLSRQHLRNRVRLDLLPALEAARPGFSADLLALSVRAAAWRADVEARVDTLTPRRSGQSLFVPATSLSAIDAGAHAMLWTALAARVGVALDRRATARLAEFTSEHGAGWRARARVQLSGGHEVVRHAGTFEIRRATGRGTGAAT